MSLRLAACCVVAFIFPALAAAGPAVAADYFLTVGGGDAPYHNQVSLESNVLYLQRVLDDIHVGQSHHDIFFADGREGGRNLQHRQAIEPPRVNQLLARILGNNESSIGIEYRAPNIPAVRGPSNRKSLGEWFDTTGAKLAEGDRLVIYFTGHGGRGTPPRNTAMLLWGEKPMPVKEFTALLDKVPPKVQVVLVMVQCFSGGFADVLFKDGVFAAKPEALTGAMRCGFFATVPERTAAGCTPDINEDNYHEYSTYFWSAMCGRTRLGAVVEKPDYDGDGQVSFAEAHAYVKLTSDTIDIPVSTSDTFLRAFSKTTGGARVSPEAPRSPRRRGNGGNADAPPTTRPSAVDSQTASSPSTRPAVEAASTKLMSVDTPYATLAATADPARRAVLDGLSDQLKLAGPERARAARDLANQLQRDRDSSDAQRRTAQKAAAGLRDRIAAAVRSRWPELAVAYHPKQAQIVRVEGDAVVKFIESHKDFTEYEAQRELADTFESRSIELERKWVKTQRFLRTAEEVALAANLPSVASPELNQRYNALLASEYGYIKPAQ